MNGVNLATRYNPARAKRVPEGTNPGARGHSYNQGDHVGKGGPEGVGLAGPWGMFWGPWRLGLERQAGLFLGEP